MTKDLENVMNVLISIRDNSKKVLEVFKDDNNEKMIKHYEDVIKEQNMILMMIHDKKHLKDIADVYDVKLR